MVAGKSRVGDGERTAVVEDGATMAGSSGRFGSRGEDGSEDRASTAHLVVGKNAAIDYDRSAVVQRAALAGRRRERIGAEVTAAGQGKPLQRQTGAAVDDEEPARVVAVEGDVVAVGIDESIPGDDFGRGEDDASIAVKTHQAAA